MATASPMDVNAAAVEGSRLLSLPQELQDHIFSYAYPPPPEGVNLITKRVWDRKEMSARLDDSSYTIRPFPAPKVANFLVSKRFLANAASAYVGPQEVKQQIVVATSDGGDFEHNILLANATHISGCYISALSLSDYPKLRKITLTLGHREFLDEPCFYDLLESSHVSDEALKSTKKFRSYLKVALSEFVVKADELFTRSEVHEKNWQANVQRFGELLEPIVQQNWDRNQEDIERSADESREMRRKKELDVLLLKSVIEDLVDRTIEKIAEEEHNGGRDAPTDEEIPDDAYGILKCMFGDPSGMVAWIQEAKEFKKAKKA